MVPLDNCERDFLKLMKAGLKSTWVFCLLMGCAHEATSKNDTVPNGINSMVQTSVTVGTQPKNLFVFLDGTRNDQISGTNVLRLYDLLSKNNDFQTKSIYIEGVGSVDRPIMGASLGRGMEKRILTGYEFLALNYKPGDRIFIFGFSRGAHQARSLAGLLAYAGLPIVTEENRTQLMPLGENILNLAKEITDTEFIEKWGLWKPGHSPLLAGMIRKHLQQDMQPVEIEFLGVWDTVPGSSFKNYKDCMETIGFWKINFNWLPIISKGERYKSGSYPPIHQIAHALSIDEKRSKFAPLRACPPLNPQYTAVEEVWFPGAHADVGGGYEDSNELSSISLNWMIMQLSSKYKFHEGLPLVEATPHGLAHWSIGDFPANIGSDCEDRVLPEGAVVHESFHLRKKYGPVPIRINGQVLRSPYQSQHCER